MGSCYHREIKNIYIPLQYKCLCGEYVQGLIIIDPLVRLNFCASDVVHIKI